ncbi:LysR substrate-binding domain-containing protein [Variovorax sp. MHTC-1]|uniref:LysR substrate-binding domain-containing protein n=1 Tax=Variovorax sp. MHTC-1 TaxID=2495593 RepID=UPI000F89D48E|nr:LysR substrate-binding domain-containing protein [Variovorax sp. MHTC-1]RST50040.1 hypothetical protein EJI01_22640 [Variovorax sp. MHTC-1]
MTKSEAAGLDAHQFLTQVIGFQIDGSSSAILNLVHQSDFCTVLPRVAVRRPLEHASLRGHALTAPRLARQIVCVTHPRRPLGPAASAFVAVLIKHVRGLEHERAD